MALELDEVSVNRGAGPVIRDVSMAIEPGSIAALVGPNGAGKTSLLESVSGIVRPSAGSIRVDGRDITALTRRQRARTGVLHVEQGRAVFPSLTVRQHIELASRRPAVLREMLEYFPELEKRLSSSSVLLSGGEQQMLVLARALAARPRYLLIDEMSLGLAPVVFLRLLPVLGDVARSGVGILLVEQFAHLALGVAQQAVVVSGGDVTYQGRPDALLKDDELLRSAYMGD